MRRDNNINNSEQQQQQRRRFRLCCCDGGIWSVKTTMVVAVVFAVYSVLYLNSTLFLLIENYNNNMNYEQYSNPTDESPYDSMTSNSSAIVLNKKLIVLVPSQVSTDLLRKSSSSDFASEYYSQALNEESAELWLYRNVIEIQKQKVSSSYQYSNDDDDDDDDDADYYVLPGLLHLYYSFTMSKQNQHKHKHKQDHSFVHKYKNLIVNKTKPHLILIPTWNIKICNIIGLRTLIKQLQEMGVTNLWSVGFERNTKWQGGIDTKRIIPIPYVVKLATKPDDFDIIRNNNETVMTTPKPTTTKKSTNPAFNNSISSSSVISSTRLNNFVFYVGDKRKNAKGWAGCDRERLIKSLLQAKNNDTTTTTNNYNNNMYVRIISNKNKRLNQSEYNRMMSISDYCLILCGDTPSTRTLTSSIAAGCIPIRVGSRLRGLCEPPCKKGFGWKITGLDQPHLPYGETINWDIFPEVDEGKFMLSGNTILQDLFQQYDNQQKAKIRSIMDSTRNSWIYGYGDPVTSNIFGGATVSILKSFELSLDKSSLENKSTTS